MQAQPELWVDRRGRAADLQISTSKWWLKAIQALLEVKQFGLDRFAEYVLQTRHAIEDGHPMLSALGVALPALHLPRDTGFFRSLTDKTAGHLSKWKALYTQCVKKRYCYLLKQTPSQTLLLEDDLHEGFRPCAGCDPGGAASGH